MANHGAPIDTNSERMNQKDASPSHGEAVVGIEEDHGAGHGPEPTALGFDAPAYISFAMLAVILIILWKKVPGAIGRALDKQIESIRKQLAEAAKLRTEAEALRNEYQAKAAAADTERQTMLDRARQEADAIVEQAKIDTAALIERRSRIAEEKIAAAERQAIDEVRARAATAAAAAAAELISQEVGPDADKGMVDRTISELGRV